MRNKTFTFPHFISIICECFKYVYSGCLVLSSLIGSISNCGVLPSVGNSKPKNGLVKHQSWKIYKIFNLKTNLAYNEVLASMICLSYCYILLMIVNL